MRKIIDFIKYNNATVIILAVALLLAGGALAAGPEAIGGKRGSGGNIDNTLLLAADLDNFSLDFKIEKLEADDDYYYAVYSYLDLTVLDSAWQYQLNSRSQKISKKIQEDLGEYLAKFLAKHHQARVRQLRQEQRLANLAGNTKRVEVTEYSGLIGKTLDLAAKVFPGYEPVKKRRLPAPEFIPPPPPLPGEQNAASGADNLTQIYNDYLAAHPELFADTAPDEQATASSTQEAISPGSPDQEAGRASSTPTAEEPETVDIIELPAEEPRAESETEPVAEAPAEPEPEPGPDAAPETVPEPVPDAQASAPAADTAPDQ